MKLRHEPEAADLAAVKDWFQALADHVQAVDYDGALGLFADDMIAFGTFTDFMIGREPTVANQWKNVWGTIRRFRWRMDEVHAIVSADRLTGVGMAVFDSDGYTTDGEKFDRRGRATVSFARQNVGDPWVATHTHMSLFRGTPDQSHGAFSTPG